MTRWARYGHDRLYVQTPDGTRLGYLDNKTGQTVLEPGADPQAVAAALTAHGASAAQPEKASSTVAPTYPVAPPVAPPAQAPVAVVVPEPGGAWR